MKKKSGRICLVRPAPRRWKKIFDHYEPLNLLFLGTFLKKAGIEVKIIDDYLGEDVIGEINKFKPLLVGFSALTFTYPRAVELMKMVKAGGFLTVIGGVHASARPEAAIADGFDMAVVGEGEKVFLEIIKTGARRGIFYSSREKQLPADEWLPLDRSLVNMEAYCLAYKRSAQGEKVRTANLITSLGCPYRCIFCHNSVLEKPPRFMPPGMVIEEIKALISDYRIKHVDFSDDDFFINKPRAKKICELIIENNFKISWGALTRESSLDEDLIQLASRAGCRRLGFGFESGSQKILDILQKNASVEKNLEVAGLCRKHGIQVTAFMTIGNPGETGADLQLTWEFIRKVSPDNIGLAVLVPFPGTRLWQQCLDRGLVPENPDFSIFYYHTPIQIPDTFSPEQVEWQRLIMQVKSYLLIPRLRNKLFRYMLTQPVMLLGNLLESLPLGKKFK